MALAEPTVICTSPFWGDSYVMLGKRVGMSRIASLFINRNRSLRASLDAAIALLSSTSIADSYYRVTAVADIGGDDLGGVRPVETFVVENHTSTAADIVTLDNIVDEFKDAPLTYVEDASGNGGGGKDGF